MNENEILLAKRQAVQCITVMQLRIAKKFFGAPAWPYCGFCKKMISDINGLRFMSHHGCCSNCNSNLTTS